MEEHVNARQPRQPHDFDHTDMAIFAASTGVALIGSLRLVQGDELFLRISSLVLALGFLATSAIVARSPTRSGLPLFSIFHVAFWAAQASYALHSGTAQHAINAHQRVSNLQGPRHAVVWVVMGAVGGFYQGTPRAKLLLFVCSMVLVTTRNVVLALRWEASTRQPPVRPSVAQLLRDVKDAALGDTRGRLSSELVLNGSVCLVCSMLLGLGLGMLIRARSQQRQKALSTQLRERDDRLEQLLQEKERITYELMLAKHTPNPSRPTVSEGGSSYMSECAMPMKGFEDDVDVYPAAELRRRGGAHSRFSAIANRDPSPDSGPTSGRASEIISPTRAAALWRTLEDSGITLTRTRAPTECSTRPSTDMGEDTKDK